jgi:hypothetical protein
LVVSVSTAGAAPTLRVQVWRKLRSLGALYIQQSVCLLPERPEVLKEVRRLVDRVHHHGGTARVLHMSFTLPAEEQAMIAEVNEARDLEYAEVLERLPALRQELAGERQRGRTTYAEVEESESDLDRFWSWLGKINARDYFQAPKGVLARAAVQEAADDLAAFEESALRTEYAEPTEIRKQAGRLRVVDGS